MPSAAVLGSQTPTHRLVPAGRYSKGEDVLDMARLVGIDLDEWQRDLILDALTVGEDGLWAAFEVAIEIARQNGKSVVLDLVALTALYVWRLKTIVYSAHEGTTAMETFGRLEEIIKRTPSLRAETPDRSFHQANGKEKIRIASGRILFKTRTPGSGRGLSGDLVIADEAQSLKDSHIAAVFPTLRARPNPQIWYAGSAGDQGATVLGRLVRRIDRGIEQLEALANGEPVPEAELESRLCGWRFAADESDDPGALETWVKTNPALGRRVSVAWMQGEYRSLSAEKFARELITIGDYPREDGEDWVIPASRYKATTLAGRDEQPLESVRLGRGWLAIDAHPTQEWASVAIAGPAGVYHRDEPRSTARPNGDAIHVEVLEHMRGVRWLPSTLKQLLAHLDVEPEVVLDPKGPLGRMVHDLEDAGIKVRLLETVDVPAACAFLYDGIVNQPPTIYHRGAPVLTSAIAAAATRNLLGGFAWRRHGATDISPLYSVTFAAYAAATWGRRNRTTAPAIPQAVTAGRRQAPTRTSPSRRRAAPVAGADVATVSF